MATPLPEEVCSFLMQLYGRLRLGDYEGLKRLYDTEYPSISTQLYASRSWPSPEDVEEFYTAEKVYHALIMAFYKELMFRHLYSECKGSVYWEDRNASWTNYKDLFTFFIESQCIGSNDSDDALLVVPNQWLWDIHDEFVYQFHDMCRYRASLGSDLPEDPVKRMKILQEFQNSQEVWPAPKVLGLFHHIADISGVQEWLRAGEDLSYTMEPKDLPLRIKLGYFAKISLLRIYTLIGQYSLALSAVEDIQITSRGIFSKIPTCQLTLLYYTSVSCMMLKRYNDTLRLLSQFFASTKQKLQMQLLTHQQASSNKMIDRMYMIMMMCSTLGNTKVDDSISTPMKESFADKYNKLCTYGDISAYQDVFMNACPKFINPGYYELATLDTLEMMASAANDPQKRQFALFVKEIDIQKNIAEVSSIASLYNNIQLGRLANLMDIKAKDPTEAMKSLMLSIKHKIGQQSAQREDENAPGASKLEFFLEGDVVHVKATKKHKSYTEELIHLIGNSSEIVNRIKASNATAVGSWAD